MRKLLLATTALAGAALFAGAAQAHQGMEVTVGGYNDFRAGFFGEDTAGIGARRKNDFENEFNLDVEAKAKANNGMEYGAVASLWNGSDFTSPTAAGNRNAVRLHQAYGYINGAWGQLRAGDDRGVASDMHVAAPQTYGYGGQVDGYYTDFISTSINAISPHFADDDNNSTKVSYLTPKVGFGAHKFQAGVSYAPNGAEQGQSVNGAKGGSGYMNEVQGALTYEGSVMDKVSVLAAATVQTADADTGALPTVGVVGQDYTAYDVGGQVGYAGFTVGGNYAGGGRLGAGQGQSNAQHAWSVGAGYKFDRASFAGSYLKGRGYNNGSAGAGAFVNTDTNYSTYEVYGFGAGYSLFDGMTTSVDTAFFRQEAPAGGLRTGEGHVVILSNRVAF